MKILFWLFSLVIGILAIVYVALFTPIGNDFAKPYIEEEIKKYTHLESKLNQFTLGFSSYDIVLELDKFNIVELKGSYSIAFQSIHTEYKLKLSKLENLSYVLQRKLKGSVQAYGTLKGDQKHLTTFGEGVVASGDIRYHVELDDLKVTSIITVLKGGQIGELLELANEKAYANGKIDVDLNFSDVTPNNLNGTIKVASSDGKINADLLKEQYNLELPSASFNVKIDAKLQDSYIDYDTNVLSSLLSIKSAGKIKQDTLLTKLTYSIDTKEIALLQKLTKQNFRGPCNLSGTIQGDKKLMNIYGQSDLADSQTKLLLTLHDLIPVALKGQMKNINIRKMLYFLNEENYADGLLTIDMKLDDIRKGKRKGVVITSIRKGSLNHKFFNEEKKFKSKMPPVSLEMDGYSVLNNDMVDSKVNLRSSLANITAKKFIYNTQSKHIDSDYLIDIANVQNLYFITQKNIDTPLVANGHINKTQDMKATLHTVIAKGTVDATIFNDNVEANLQSIDTLELLRITKYPQIFKALLNANLVYDMKAKRGNVKAAMTNGKFAQNNAFTLVHKYTNFNLYKENFNGRANANFTDEIAIASLQLKSNSSSIKTENTKVFLNTKKLDSKVDIVANNNPVSFIFTGDIAAPNVDVDMQELIKDKAKKDVNDRIDKFLRKIF